ncbi:MAG: biopolymer transporter ExbD [Bacteroidetes bacterium]|nr:biopolymer transporter ExbD [Bacteroidota bacterium]MBK9673569.1 biopolymer transporter ExbD [Bacteroidota bacterium]MBK9799131.1 biopolymer transporter ExbD [Bacteroidota bacterium]MBP6412371.1 biopolymer transporter ExbD [Bacteroidia bacterium]
MAELNTDGGGGHGKHEKKRAKKSSTKIDMTPMVDLAFLLLTFFMLTTTFSKPKTMELNMPADPKDIKDQPKVKNAITFLLTENNKVYWYYGEFKPTETKLEKTDFSKDGIHKILLEDYNKDVATRIMELEKKRDTHEIADTTFKRLAVGIKGEKKALMALVKTDDKATYGNVIDMLDELNVCYVGKYALVDISAPELELVKQQPN